MKTKVGLQVVFSSLILAFCMIVFGAEAHATTLTGNPSAFNGGATAGCTPHLSSDWIDTFDWGYRLLTPTDCAIVKITTPTFSWRQLADRNLTIPWNFILRNASNPVIFTATSPSPRLLLDDYPLAPGTYSWQVNAASSTWKLTAWTPLLTEADRTVVFNRVEKVAIIYDYATSATPRQWELNYHTMLSSPFIVSGGTIEIDNAPGKACIDHYGLPGNFTQITAFDVAPENGLPDQNHGRYTATTKSTVLTAVTVIREDCRTLPVNVTFSGSNAFVSLNSSSPIIFDKKTVQVPAI